MHRRAKFAWGVLGFHVLVILWGAFVRITFSGDGCGNHWPLCNGDVVPSAPTVHTLIEYSHRTSSGAAVLFAVALAWVTRKEANHIRRATLAALFFDFMEAVIGMLLVKLRLVGDNPSMKRALSGSLHLVNTFLLLAALSMAALWLTSKERNAPTVVEGEQERRALDLRGGLPLLFVVGTLALILTAMSGAVAAFGDTLYRVATLREAITADFSGTSALLLRLRVFHPAIALLGGVFVFGLATVTRWIRPDARHLARATSGLFAAQVLLGLANVVWLAPPALQIGHLLVGQALWISYVLMATIALRPTTKTRELTLRTTT